jgi:transposase
LEEKQGKYLTPFQRKFLLKSLQTDLRSQYRRRIEIMLLADKGLSQAQIVKQLRCSNETVRYWTDRAKLGQAHNWKDCSIGRPKIVNDRYLNRLKELVSRNPREYGYPFQSWTAQWLATHLAKELGVEISCRRVNMLLKEMGLSTRQKPELIEPRCDRKKNTKIIIDDLQPEISLKNSLLLNSIKVNN